MRTVIKVEGWHIGDNGDRFSPSVMRLVFYRDQKFVRIYHTFFNSKDPDTCLITDIAIEVPFTKAMNEAVYATDHPTQTTPIGDRRFVVFQEDLAGPTYPPSQEFEGRFRVRSDGRLIAEGKRYPGALVVRGNRVAASVFVKNMWQMSPKSIAYDREGNLLHVGI